MYKYYVTRDGVEKEVTVEQFCYVEREAGFYGPGHYDKPMGPATSSFAAPGISGRAKYIRESD